MNLNVVATDKTVWSGQAESVSIPTTMGIITILPGHMPLTGLVSAGELVIKTGGREESLAVSGGVVNVTFSGVEVLADFGIRTADIVEAEIEKARKAAEDRMAKITDEEDFALAQAELTRAILQLRVAGKRRRGI